MKACDSRKEECEMTCKEIMTPDPSCCVPGDSVAMAAQIMKRSDVGPVPVVSDQHEKRLVGIVIAT